MGLFILVVHTTRYQVDKVKVRVDLTVARGNSGTSRVQVQQSPRIITARATSTHTPQVQVPGTTSVSTCTRYTTISSTLVRAVLRS
jgi:hypothetical protein